MNPADDPHRPSITPLDAFCLAQVVGRLRYGTAEMCIEIGKRIARGASLIVGRKVPVAELFDLDYDLP